MVGIYKITNKINGKVYIGQSTGIEHRWEIHLKRAFEKSFYGYNYPLYRAIRKDGIKNFSFEVIEECLEEELDNKEIFWIAKYKSFPVSLGFGYNILPGGKGNYRRLNKSQILDVIEILKTQKFSYREIAKKYNVCKDIIGFINKGTREYKLEDINYPIVDKYYPINRLDIKPKPKKYTSNNYSKYYDRFKICPLCGGKMTYNSKKCNKCKTIIIPPKSELLTKFNEFNYMREEVAKFYGISGNLLRKWCNSYEFKCQDKKLLKELYKKEVLGEEIIKLPPRAWKNIIKQIDPNTNEVINTFYKVKDIVEYLHLSGNEFLCKAIKNHTLYKEYYWEREKL